MNDFLSVPPADRLVSVAQMQAIERAADHAGYSYAAMMESAGRRVAEIILQRFGHAPVLVLAGPGNNGGDGLVCARILQAAGAAVRVYLWKRRTDRANDAQGFYRQLLELGVQTAHADDDGEFATLRQWLDGATVVDALLGTGANRPLEGQLADLLDHVAAAQQVLRFPIVAVDCASGLNCDSGAVSDHTLAPQVTVTFAHAKLGHYRFPGAEYVGGLVVADIGIPPGPVVDLIADLRTFVLTEARIRTWLPRRPRYSHKGTFGKVMLAVGSEQFPGAAYLASAAAGRVGAGLVTAATPQAVWSLVAARLPEPTWVVLPGGDGSAQAQAVTAALQGYSACVVGCGLGNNAVSRHFVTQLLAGQLPPTVIDADGLNCLAQVEQWPALLPERSVLTPHPAELARLSALTTAEVTERRWELAQQQAAAWRCVVLAKGPYTVIAHPAGWLAVLPVATPALATAGSGDVLAGMIGGLLAQGLAPFEAACTGAWLHGNAGLRCEAEIGRAGVVASDLLPRVPAVLAKLQS